MNLDDGLSPNRLKFVRRRLGLSQAKMGQLMNVHQTLVSHWEHGTRTPDAYQQALYGLLLRASQIATEAHFEAFDALLKGQHYASALVMMAAIGMPGVRYTTDDRNEREDAK